MKMMESRSNCPIGKTLDVVGDRWTLLIMRHMIFAGSTTYKELSEIPEHIASNILAERLDRLDKVGVIRKLPDSNDGRKNRYRLTEKGVDLMSILLAMMDWGLKYHPDASYPKDFAEQAVKNRIALLEEARSL